MVSLAAVLLALLSATPAEAAIRSPSGKLTAQVVVSGRTPKLIVRRDGRLALRADLGRLRAPGRAKTLVAEGRFSGAFETVAGKRRLHTIDATRTVISFGGGAQLELALGDDGAAFRETGFASTAVRYRPADGTEGYLQRLTSSYERAYAPTPIRSARGNVGYPALLSHRGTYTLLTETGLPYGEPGEHLVAASAALTTAPAAGSVASKPGWRVAIIGTLADVVASDLMDDFAAPSKITDTSWIRPGRVAWSWWSDSWSPHDYATQKDYVDFAHEAGFEYVLVDAGWDAAWVPDLVDYAEARGVRILLWVDWHALETPSQRVDVLDRFEHWGVAGVKADFLQSDSGARMAVQEDIAADAASRHLLVSFHGATVPRGLQRTWPNVMTVEGVRGAEYVKGIGADDPALGVTLAFTRNVIGSMDFTPVTFSAAGRLTSAAAQLAQAVVYESGLQHFADAPASYRSRPAALQLLRSLPAAWDGVQLVSGSPGRTVTLARRAGDRWFVGSLSALSAHRERVALRFLDPGRTYTAKIYADVGRDGIAVTERQVTRATTLTVPVARDGGFTISLAVAGQT